MGALDYLSNFCAITSTGSKRRPMPTVDIGVKMDCDGCERRVKNAVLTMKSVKTVVVNRTLNRVTVTGYVEPNKVLKRVKATGKGAEFWPYIPHHLVLYPYAAQVYDKRPPGGYVRNVGYGFPSNNVSAPEGRITTMFSDDNVNACSIM